MVKLPLRLLYHQILLNKKTLDQSLKIWIFNSFGIFSAFIRRLKTFVRDPKTVPWGTPHYRRRPFRNLSGVYNSTERTIM